MLRQPVMNYSLLYKKQIIQFRKNHTVGKARHLKLALYYFQPVIILFKMEHLRIYAYPYWLIHQPQIHWTALTHF